MAESEPSLVNRWAEIVIESFTATDVAAWARGRSIPLEELAGRRARFLAGGCQALMEPEGDERWYQIDAALDRDPNGELVAGGDFLEQVESWLRDQKVRCFWFLHKPPGIRFRFSSRDPDFRTELSARFGQWAPGAWAYGFYEPELYQFGGAAGLDLAHRYFTIESLAVLGYRERALRGNRLGAYEFSLRILNFLFRHVTSGNWELWDVWCNLQLAGRLATGDLAPSADLATLRHDWLPLVFESGVANLSRAEKIVWHRYQDRIQELVPDILEAARSGKLLWPLRQILPFWAVFHWNRMCLGVEEQRRLARIMAVVLSPKW